MANGGINNGRITGFLFFSFCRLDGVSSVGFGQQVHDETRQRGEDFWSGDLTMDYVWVTDVEGTKRLWRAAAT
jgi:hypothetical protein